MKYFSLSIFLINSLLFLFFFFLHLIARVQNIKNFIQVSRELNINNIVRMRCKKAFETQFQFFRLKFHLNRYLHVHPNASQVWKREIRKGRRNRIEFTTKHGDSGTRTRLEG
uniref:Uncharacterized protein n=1 Tax=Cacopsylla melanoneura TaxID=428564 RepID=A0A8D8VYE0_9HEMI